MKSIIKTETFEKYMKEHNLNKTQFCKLCNIGFSTFNKLMTNSNNLSSMVLYKIAKATNIKLNEMFNWKYFIDICNKF